MGHWGFQPWENDSAADWLDQFAEQADLSTRVKAGLSLPLDQIDEVRAAAHLLLNFSKLGLISTDATGQLVELAIHRLNEAVESGVFTNPDFVRIVTGELAQLRGLLAHADGAPLDELVGSTTAGEFLFANGPSSLALYDVVDVAGVIPDTRTQDVVGTGFLDDEGSLHLQLEDGRDRGLKLRCRCVPDSLTRLLDE